MTHHRFQGPCFGRRRDLAELMRRAERQGITAVFARANSGKSRLFGELEKQLARSAVDKRIVVGYAEGSRQADLLLRAISDCYSRSLSDATMLRQARAVWSEISAKWVGRLGDAGRGLAELLRTQDSSGLTTTALHKTFTLLGKAQSSLNSGGLNIEPLPFDSALHLLNLAHELAKRRLVLILDAYEQLGPAGDAHNLILQRLLENDQHWPYLHIFIGVRTPDDSQGAATPEIVKALRNFNKTHDYCFNVHSLGTDENRLELNDFEEFNPMINWVRLLSPGATKQKTDDELLNLIDGHAGVLGRWRKLQPQSPQELKTTAKNAIHNRYPELNGLINEMLSNPLYRNYASLATMLALLPEITNEEQWQTYRYAIKHVPGTSVVVDSSLEALIQTGLLEASYPFPSFGDTTRYEAMRSLCVEKNTPAVLDHASRTAEKLIVGLARTFKNRSIKASLSSQAISTFSLDMEKTRLTFSAATLALIDASQWVLNAPKELRTKPMSIAAERFSGVSGLIGAALNIALINALAETNEVWQNNLIDDLRALFTKRSNELAAREGLCMGLYNALLDATLRKRFDRQHATLKSLEDLGRSHIADSCVRGWLAKALVVALSDSVQRERYDRRDALLEQLRMLQSEDPSDKIVLECFTAGSWFARQNKEQLEKLSSTNQK